MTGPDRVELLHFLEKISKIKYKTLNINEK
jgi:hypothetical protein